MGRDAVRRPPLPALPPATVLQLGTQAGAAALGIADECGVIAVGRRADFAIVSLPPDATDDPHDLLFDDGCQVTGTAPLV